MPILKILMHITGRAPKQEPEIVVLIPREAAEAQDEAAELAKIIRAQQVELQRLHLANNRLRANAADLVNATMMGIHTGRMNETERAIAREAANNISIIIETTRRRDF